MKKIIFLLLVGMGLARQGKAGEAIASSRGRPEDDIFFLLINNSPSPQEVKNLWTLVTEGPIEYHAIPPTDFALAPGEVKLAHRNMNQAFNFNHFHTEAELPNNHHEVSMIGFIMSKEGHVSQVMGNAEHGTQPTLQVPPRIPDTKYNEAFYFNIGYVLMDGTVVTVVINNGPSPNKADVQLKAAEPPDGSVCGNFTGVPCDVDYHDFGDIGPNETVTVDLRNDAKVPWAHHGTIILTALQDLDFYVVYKNAAGEIYGTMNKDKFFGVNTGPEPPDRIYPASINILSPQEGEAVETTLPVIRWAPPEPGEILPNTRMLNYFVEVSRRPFDVFEWVHFQWIPHSDAKEFTYQIPAIIPLERGRTYYFRITPIASYPGIDGATWPAVKQPQPQGYRTFSVAP